jgi:hypothetical protein
MFHMGFVHAVLLDFAEGRDGSSWDRERRLADRLIETSTRFDWLYEPAITDPEEAPPPRNPPPGGMHAIVAGVRQTLGRVVTVR